jgi:HAD superfamily hydrolase (TIGR01509 family)
MRALILDFDGLMVDTEWPSFLAWQEVYAEHGATLSLAEWAARVGSDAGFDPVETLRARADRPVGDTEALLADRQRRKVARIAAAPLMPGVADAIAQARALGWPVGIASSSPRDWVGGHLDRLGMRDAVDAIATGDEVPRVKPDPAVFLLVASRLAVPPARCVVCEDSLSGVRAAKAAGMFAIAVPNRVTTVQDFAIADRRLASLAELRLARLIG